MIAFFPACLPASKMTTLPAFILDKTWLTSVIELQKPFSLQDSAAVMSSGKLKRKGEEYIVNRLTFSPLLMNLLI
jgi:hypothetical protein